MTINTSVDTSCNESNSGGTFNITNNSLIGTATAELNGEGNPTAAIGCKLGYPYLTGNTTIPINVYGFNAQYNYLSSPNNQYLTNANTINPTQTNNFCSPAAGTVTGCATSGFTTPPTWR